MKKIVSFIDNNYKIYWVIVVAGFLFLLWRVKYGYGYNDEPFVISLAQRLDKGDALIADEWHLAMNFGAVLLPLYKVFHLIKGPTNDGLFLTFRHIYAVFWTCTCAYVGKFIWKRFNTVFGAILVFLYIEIFSPLEQNIISYTSVGLMCALLLCCMIVEIYDDQKKVNIYTAVIMSALIVLFVLSLPYIALIYVLLVLGLNVLPKSLRTDGICRIRKLINLTIPIIAIVCIYYLWEFVFSRAELSVILKSIPFILDDPEHGHFTVIEMLYKIPSYLLIRGRWYYISILVTIVATFILKKTNKQKYADYLVAVCAVLYMIYQYMFVKNVDDKLLIDQVALFIGAFGIVIFILLKDVSKLEFWVFTIMSMTYTLIRFYTTDTGLTAISMTGTIIGVLSITYIVLLIRENYTTSFLKVILVLVLFTQICTQFYCKLNRQYIDSNMEFLTQKIEFGVCKGIYTTADNKQRYEVGLYDMHTALNSEGVDRAKDSFMCISMDPVVYVDANMNYATFSTWESGFGEKLEKRFMDYIEITGKNPDVIFAVSPEDELKILTDGYTRTQYGNSVIYTENK